VCAAPGGPLPGADESITAAELAELEALVDAAGWPMAKRLLLAVSDIDRREQLSLVTHRELATLRIALAVAAGTTG
jgi:hypothetical protein